MRGRLPLGSARAVVFAIAFGVTGLMGPDLAIAAKSSAPSAKKPFVYDTSGVVSIGADPSSVSGPAVLQFQGVTGSTFNPTVAQPINLGQFVAVPSSLASGQATTYNDTPFEVEVQAPEFNKSSSVPVLDQIIPSLDKKLDLKSSVENSLLLKGHLDGTVSANGQVNVTATVDSIKLGSIEGGGSGQVVHYTFPIRYSQFILPPSWVLSNSSTSVTVPTSTPNPVMSPLSTVAGTSSTSTSTTTSSVAPAPSAEMVTVTTASGTATNPATAPLPTPAPEPSTILMFATVLGGLALGRRRLRAR
jgi:hypothetical protein